MEGAATTRKVAKDMLRKNISPRNRGEQMISNNYDCIRYISEHKDEPLTEDNPLWTAPRVTITPHNSFVSDKNSDRMFSLILRNLTQFDFGKATR